MTKEELLIVLIEEAGEVIQAATKCLRFTWDENYPSYGINHEILAAEIGDLIGIVKSLPLNISIIEQHSASKLEKVKLMAMKYPSYA